MPGLTSGSELWDHSCWAWAALRDAWDHVAKLVGAAYKASIFPIASAPIHILERNSFFSFFFFVPWATPGSDQDLLWTLHSEIILDRAQEGPQWCGGSAEKQARKHLKCLKVQCPMQEDPSSVLKVGRETV